MGGEPIEGRDSSQPQAIRMHQKRPGLQKMALSLAWCTRAHLSLVPGAPAPRRGPHGDLFWGPLKARASRPPPCETRPILWKPVEMRLVDTWGRLEGLLEEGVRVSIVKTRT